jgi:ABC-type branched-subunit amino acid transport system substrate-binding protein
MRLLGAGIVLALLVAACGARTFPLEPREIGAGGEIGNPVAGGAAQGGVGGPEVGAPQEAAPPGTAAVPGGGAQGGAQAAGPRAAGRACTAPARSTDVGVNRTTVKLGAISALTGAFPGQFNPNIDAVDAYFKALNAAGGICGRRFQLIIHDDAGDAANNKRLATKLAVEDKVFAFVGSLTSGDTGIAQVSRKYKIPDIGFPLTFERSENPYSFGVPGQISKRYFPRSVFGARYLGNRFKIKQWAWFFLSESDTASIAAWANQAGLARFTGARTCFEQGVSVFDNSFAQYVLRMRSSCRPEDGPVGVAAWLDTDSTIKLAQAMRDQGFKPNVFAGLFSAYLPSFITNGGSAVEGVYLIAFPQLPFERLDRPRSEWTPGVVELSRYVSALNRYVPGHSPPGTWGGSGWGAGVLFGQAARTCGANLTRACLLKTINGMGRFSANGYLSPARPRDHAFYSADLMVRVQNGKFVEFKPPGAKGPPGAVDFWDYDPGPDGTGLWDWMAYYCANKEKFINPAEKDRLVDCSKIRS